MTRLRLPGSQDVGFNLTSTILTPTPASVDLRPGTWNVTWEIQASGPGKFYLYARAPELLAPTSTIDLGDNLRRDLQYSPPEWYSRTVRYKTDVPTTLVVWVRCHRDDRTVHFPHWRIEAIPAQEPLSWDGWPLGEPSPV